MNDYINIIRREEFVNARKKAQDRIVGELFNDVHYPDQFRDNINNLEKIIKESSIDIIRETADAVHELCREHGYGAAYLKYADIRNLLSEKFDSDNFTINIRDLITIVAICNKVMAKLNECNTEYSVCDVLLSINTIIDNTSCIEYVGC